MFNRENQSTRVRVLQILSGDLWAGKELQVALQSRALIDIGLDCRVLLFNESETARRLRELGIPVEIVSEKQPFLSFLRSASRAVRAWRPQAVIAHGHKEFLVMLSSAPLVSAKQFTTFHGTIELHHAWNKKIRTHLALAFRKWVSALACSQIFVVTRALADELTLPHHKTTVIPNAVNFRERLPTFIGVGSRNDLVVVGRLVPIKQIELAIHAFDIFADSHRESRLIIVGDGPERPRLEHLVRQCKHQDQIKFVGFQSSAEQFIAASRCLVLTSVREGLPTVVLEAMKYGVPIVTTPLAGVTEALERVSGYPAFSGRNVTELQEALRKAWNAPPASGSILTQVELAFSPETAAKSLKPFLE